MSRDGSMTFSCLLPLRWWRRLQRVAATCHTAPRDFVRQIVEAEIVRREL